MTLKELFSLLQASQLTVCPYVLTGEIEQIKAFAANKAKVVLKIANEEIIHKSEHGLVKTHLGSEEEIEEAYASLIAAAKSVLPEGSTPRIIVQEMMTEGLEFILGAKHDPHFGKVVMFGIGGIFVEIYRDISLRVLPVDIGDACQMIEELEGNKVLQGFRQFAAVDKNALAETIVTFADMIESHPEIVEMDLNPIIWSEKLNKSIIVDSRGTDVTS